MFIIYLSIIAITVFFIIFGYYNQLKVYEQKEYERLQALASSVALGLDGDLHEDLMQKHKWKDDITEVNQDSSYYEIHKYLNEVARVNNLNTPLYTLMYNNEEDIFYYCVRSDENVYFRHSYEIFPDSLIKLMETGGTLPPYMSENGTWLSAVHPIRNKDGNVVAIMEADVNFDYFIQMVRKQYLNQALIALVVILILALILIPFARKILRKDVEMKNEILIQKQTIENKNRDITSSIHYARKIQESLLPNIKSISKVLPKSFIFYRPRDIVSGDFYWFEEREGEILLSAVDCTGHGIPGALMSMIGHSQLNSIAHHLQTSNPGEILYQLDKAVSKAFKETTSDQPESKDGMDISFCNINLEKMELKFSGAYRPLIKISNDELTEIKGDRFPIGGGQSYIKEPFTTHTLKLKKGDTFYMFSDGFADQFGGPKGKKFMTKRFKKLLLDISHYSTDEQIITLDKTLNEWKGSIEQVDDILIIGFTI